MVRAMMKLTLSLYALSLTPLANAWTFLYTNAAGAVTILHNTGPKSCTPITLAADKLFTWNPDGENLCVSIYHDAKCTNRGGISCGVDGYWKKDASTNFYGVAISDNFVPSSSATPSPTETPTTLSTTTSSTETPSTSTPSTASTTTSTATTASSTTSTATAAAGAGKSTSSSSLSGGAIAGIVIGVLAAVAIIGAVFFFVGRRKRNATADSTAIGPPSSTPQGGYTPQSPMTTYPQSSSMGSSDKYPIATGPPPFRPVPGSRVVELPVNPPSAEGVSSPVSELEGESGGSHYQRL